MPLRASVLCAPARRANTLDLHRLHGKREGASVAGVERADADDLPLYFAAIAIDDGQHHRVLQRGVAVGRSDRALHTQRHAALPRCRLGSRIEAQVMLAGRTDAGAFENGRLAVRAGTRGAGRAGTRRAHAAASASALCSALPLRADLSSKPKSTWPRMRAPAATVIVPALTSPTIWPPCSSSTRCADSMLPSSSPATTTLRARTPPWTLAPTSTVRSPST